MSDVDAGIAWTVRHAYRGSEFHRRHLAGSGVHPDDIHGASDLTLLPFTTKEQLRAASPWGWNSVPFEEVARIHSSSGTTGRRTICTYTLKDLDDWNEQFARCYRYAGVGPRDRVQIMVGYGLWTAGVGFQAGAERSGAMAVPTGPGNTDLQFEMMQELGSTVICCTSSFALLLAEEVNRRGLRDRLDLRIGIMGSERWGSGMRRYIEEHLGIEAFDIYGLTELWGPGTAIECSRHDGMHYWDDHQYMEVVDPETLEPVPDGEEGELVVTTLGKEGTPLLRYRTRDLSYRYAEPCPCGSPYPRIGPITGRTDDIIKVRGVMLSPAQVDTVLSQVDGAGPEYQIHVERREAGRERVTVRFETPDPDLEGEVAQRLRNLVGLRVDTETVPPGSLPRTARKAQRVFDTR